MLRRSPVALIALACLAATPLAEEAPVGGQLRWSDGGRAVEALRLPGAASEGRARVRVRWPSLGSEVDATVGAEAIVQVDAGADATRLFLEEGLVPVRALYPAIGLWLVRGGAGEDGLSLATRLTSRLAPGRLTQAIPDLAVAHRIHAARAEPPTDPRYGGQWYLDRIEIEQAWRLEAGEPSVTVVVVDTGCDPAHEDLVNKYDAGRDVVTRDDDPSPLPGEPGAEHGTACAGIIAAEADNALGIVGTCPGCRLSCVRMLSGENEFQPFSADVDAFAFARQIDAEIVSNSWGFVDAIPVPQPLADAIVDVHTNGRGGLGALVLFASGNDNRLVEDNELLAVPGVIGVGATNNFDEATAFTNYGASVDLVAPIGTVTTDLTGAPGADPGDYSTHFGGTSSACPVAAGVAGLLVSAAPTMRADELDAILIGTTRPAPYAEPDAAGHDLIYGFGIIDPARALRRAMGLPEEGAGGAGGAGGSGGGGGSVSDGGSGGVGGSVSDGGSGSGSDAGGGDDGGGCGCSSAGSDASWLWLVALAVWLGRRQSAAPSMPNFLSR